MQLRRQKRSICCLFLLFLMLLGMCADSVQTDSSFLCAESVSRGAERGLPLSLRPVEDSAPIDQLYVPEGLRRCELTPALRPPRSDRKHDAGQNGRYAPAFPSPGWKQISFSHANDICISHEAASHAVIVSYIHRQDGQKG